MSSTTIIGLLSAIAGLILAMAKAISWFRGRNSAEAKRNKADADILEEQRDNDLHTVDDADILWRNLRERRK